MSDHGAWIATTFKQAIAIRDVAGYSGSGEILPGEVVEQTTGRLEPATRVLQSTSGSDIVIAARLFTWPDANVVAEGTVEDMVSEKVYRVLSGGPVPDLDGAYSHSEWLLGNG
jgi:hypothetical protein